MTTKEIQEKLVGAMKDWQKLETSTIAHTASTIAKTENPLIRLVMEIIQRDSNVHHRVQQIIIDSLEKESVPISPDDLDAVWSMVEEHIKLERKTIEIARASLDALKDKKGNVLQAYLLTYLQEDETKHENLLSNLDTIIKKGMITT